MLAGRLSGSQAVIGAAPGDLSDGGFRGTLRQGVQGRRPAKDHEVSPIQVIGNALSGNPSGNTVPVVCAAAPVMEHAVLDRLD